MLNAIANVVGVPSPGTALTGAANDLVVEFFALFVDLVPYAAAMLGLAWGWSLIKANLGAKKKKPT